MERYAKIPLAYQIVMDDLGWFTGEDDRHRGMPSRTGMPRVHVAEDYTVVNEIGKRKNQKICAPFVIGEWDKNNRLKGKPYMTPKPDEWDCKSKINMQEAEKCFEIIEGSDYIDLAHHGLLHGYWDEELGHDDKQFYIRPRKGHRDYGERVFVPTPAEFFDECINAYNEIYRDWGFTQKIETFVSPGMTSGSLEDNDEVFKVVRSHGFKYWTNLWRAIDDDCQVIHGITFLRKDKENIPWNAYDVNPSALPDYTPSERAIFRAHWPNFLRFDPLKNLENVEEWGKFFDKRAEYFGIMISRDIGFASRQALYQKFTKVSYPDGKIVLDFTDVDTSGALDIGDTMYISLDKSLSPKSITGARISLYEEHKTFRTYEILRQGTVAQINLNR